LEKLLARDFTNHPVPGNGQLLQLHVLRFGFLQDGDVGIGVFSTG
jgi:hypothetical protein